MWEYYPSLVEAAIEFSVYHRQVLASYYKTTFVVCSEHERAPHSKQFRLEKDHITGYVYCCKIGQSIEERKKQKAKLPEKPNLSPVGAKEDKHLQPAEYESPRNQNLVEKNKINWKIEREEVPKRIEVPSVN